MELLARASPQDTIDLCYAAFFRAAIGTMYPVHLWLLMYHMNQLVQFFFAMEAIMLFVSFSIKTCSQMFTFLFELVLLVHCRTPHSLTGTF